MKLHIGLLKKEPKGQKKTGVCERGYRWVDYHVREFFSQYRWSASLLYFVWSTNFYEPHLNKEIISFRRCWAINNVCHGWEDSVEDFFYFYSCLLMFLPVDSAIVDFRGRRWLLLFLVVSVLPSGDREWLILHSDDQVSTGLRNNE